MKSILILLAEVSGLLIIFALFLFLLNYLNVITLPNPFLKTTTPVNNTQNFTPANFKTQTPDAQIKKYQSYAARFNKPTAQVTAGNYISDAVFAGYTSQTVQVVTNEGVLNLNFDQTTLFQKYAAAARKPNTAGIIGPAPYTSVDFFKNVVLGSVIQVSYSKPSLKAIQVNYIESIKPIL